MIKERWIAFFRMVKERFSFLNNKYLIALLVFVLWISFFDQNNLFMQRKFRSEYRQLLKEREYYLLRIVEDEKRLEELMTDNENLEKFAREQYYMKRDNEELFVILKED